MPSSSETVANTVGSSRLVSLSTAWEVRYHDASVTVYPAAVFLGAVLLFFVQPLVARLLLPHYGGSAVVWTSCLFFFQALLVGGYWYAHRLTRLDGARQPIVHAALMAASLTFLPLALDAVRVDPSRPTWSITLQLAGLVGVPYLILAASSPLLQHWRAAETGSPYRLFAVSNAGSLLGLVSYPFLVEPFLSLEAQARFWSAGFVCYVILVTVIGWSARQRLLRAEAPSGPFVAIGLRGLWLSLAACGSLVLLSTTSQMTRDVAAVPFLWVLPLALYLTTFVVSFDHSRWYRRSVWTTAYVLGLAAVVLLYWRAGADAPLGLPVQIGVYALALVTSCMVCHGELARLAPHPTRLTDFYLMVAAGGALGGFLASQVAPRVFIDTWEFPLALVATRVLLTVSIGHEEGRGWRATWRPIVTVAALGVAVIWLSVGTSDRRGELVTSARNFYGILRVYDREVGVRESVVARSFYHGSTVHGSQYVGEELRALPTTYYGVDSGVGLTIAALRSMSADARGLRIGGIGLGAGTIAAHGRENDSFRFYEVDPDVVHIAENHFFYLAESAASVETVVGDARALLDAELSAGRPGGFDLLVVDAFSGDAIPVHLLTREAFELYASHLTSGGTIAVHISNRHLDLQPVLRGLAQTLEYDAFPLVSTDDGLGAFAAEWVVLTSTYRLAEALAPAAAAWSGPPVERIWTDDYSSIFATLR